MRVGHPRIPIDIGQVTGCTCVRVEIPTPDPSTSLQGTLHRDPDHSQCSQGRQDYSLVHYTQVQPADPHTVLKNFVPEWKSHPEKDNPLKLRVHRSH